MLSIFADEAFAPPKQEEAKFVPSHELDLEDSTEMDGPEAEVPAEYVIDRTGEDNGEFEIVMGRRQIASVLFVATVVLAIFSAIAYLAGKSIAARSALVAVAQAAATPTPAVNASTQPSMIEATIAPAPKTALSGNLTDAAMFAEPVTGAVYLQMAAIEKAMAAIFVDGLRKHGFQSFVAPGPNPQIYRVLIGPLPTPASFVHAKEELDKIGLNTFGRKYQK